MGIRITWGAVLTALAAAIVIQPVATASTSAPAEQRIEYGTSGNGNPQTNDCTAHVNPGGSINNAIAGAGSGAVICVGAGDYQDQLVNLDKAGVTVRSNGVGRIKGAKVRGNGATLDGFSVVGGDYNDPESGIEFAGDGIKILNNLVNGDRLIFGIRCDRGACDNGLVSRNTVTGIESIGMFIDEGTGTIIERNNIYDLHKDRSGQSYDVDGIRFWGHHTFRYNYIHDINEFASFDNPHTDCFQTYNTGARSSGTVIENNYCLRVSRQCLIAQNNSASNYEIRDITFRNNVCETYDSQSINLGSMSGVVIENNLVLSGFRYQIVNLEQRTVPNTNTTIRNNILIRAESRANTYQRAGQSTNEHFSNNLEALDTSISNRDDQFHSGRGPYPASRPQDFTDYHAYAAARDIVDKGMPGNNSTTDVDGNPRVAGPSIDLGPFEIR